MPYEIEDEFHVLHFGMGDIIMGLNTEMGVLGFFQGNPGEIGRAGKDDDPSSLNQIPVVLVFDNIESIDVVIENLKRFREAYNKELTK